MITGGLFVGIDRYTRLGEFGVIGVLPARRVHGLDDLLAALLKKDFVFWGFVKLIPNKGLVLRIECVETFDERDELVRGLRLEVFAELGPVHLYSSKRARTCYYQEV